MKLLKSGDCGDRSNSERRASDQKVKFKTKGSSGHVMI